MKLNHLKKYYLILVPGVLIILGVVMFSRSDSVDVPLTWAQIQEGDLPVDFMETGEIQAVHSVDIKAPMEWRMELQIIDMVEEAIIVEKGDFLVRFDTSVLEQRLDLAEDKLQQALADKEKLIAQQESQMTQLKNDLESARYSRDIAKLQLKLLKYEAETKRQDAELDLQKALISLEEAQTRIESQEIIHESQLENTNLRIFKARADVRDLERKIETLTLRAPMAGLVIFNEIGRWGQQHKVTIGDKVRPGETIISIPDLSEMKVSLRVNEMDAFRYQPGQLAVVSLTAYPDKQYPGHVTQVASLAQKENPESSVKDFEIIIRLEQSDSLLKPGMTAASRIAVGKITNTKYAPITTVYELNGKSVVFPQQNYPEPMEIETGQRTDEYIEIRSDRVKAGDQICYQAPDVSVHRIGYSSYIQNKDFYSERTFQEMQEQGLEFDYDGERNKRVIAKADSGARPVDVEALQRELVKDTTSKKAIEQDPKRMKKLKKALKGQANQEIRVNADSLAK